MKHLRRLFTFVLFLFAMLMTASTTYAFTTSGLTFTRVGDKVSVTLNGNTTFNLEELYQSTGSAYIDIDIRDYSGYDIANDYTFYISNNGVTSYTNATVVRVELMAEDQDNGFFDLYDKTGAYVTSRVESNSLASIYWIVTEPDASPVLSGNTAFVTNVDLPLSEASIRSNIYAYDDTDGDITHLITKSSDTYTPNMNTVGTWQIIYSVQDSAGNISTLTVHVLVRDVTAPTWNVAKAEVDVSYTQTFDIETYKSQLGVADNYDPSGSLTITVHANTYTANKTVVGTYNVIYKIKDTAGNETLAQVEVNVIDDVAPTISGPTTIMKPNKTALTVSEIKAQLTANDVVAGNLTTSIAIQEDNYSGKGHLVGSYTITFSVTDPSGNTATHVVTVTVEDNIPPIFYVKDNYFITVDQSVALTLAQIIDILEITGQLETSGTGGVELTSLVNEYTGNEDVPGIYAVSLKAITISGNESIHNVAIEVLESDTEDPIVIEEPSEWDNVWAFVVEHQDYIIGGLAILLFGLFIAVKVKGSKKPLIIKKKHKKRH